MQTVTRHVVPASLAFSALASSVFLRRKFKSAVNCYCNAGSPLCGMLTKGEYFHFTQLLFRLVYMQQYSLAFHDLNLTCTICVKYTELHVYLWGSDLKMAWCEQTETCLFLYICDAGIKRCVEIKLFPLTVKTHVIVPSNNRQQPVKLIAHIAPPTFPTYTTRAVSVCFSVPGTFRAALYWPLLRWTCTP